MKPAYPHDLPTATAWLAWCAEIDPLTRNRRHAEGCQCHHCPVARGKVASAELAQAIIAEVAEEIAARALAPPHPPSEPASEPRAKGRASHGHRPRRRVA